MRGGGGRQTTRGWKADERGCSNFLAWRTIKIIAQPRKLTQAHGSGTIGTFSQTYGMYVVRSTVHIQYSTYRTVTEDLGQYKEQTFEDRLNGSEAEQLTGERQKKEMRCREKMGRGKELRLDGLEDGQETEKAKGENRENSGKIRH